VDGWVLDGSVFWEGPFKCFDKNKSENENELFDVTEMY
jgi:hypothetical protein